jgi:hypothetical protein
LLRRVVQLIAVCDGELKQSNHLRSIITAVTKGVVPAHWQVRAALLSSRDLTSAHVRRSTPSPIPSASVAGSAISCWCVRELCAQIMPCVVA